MLWHAVGVDTRRHDRSGDLDRRRDQSSGRLCLRNFRTGSTAVSSARRRAYPFAAGKIRTAKGTRRILVFCTTCCSVLKDLLQDDFPRVEAQDWLNKTRAELFPGSNPGPHSLKSRNRSKG